MEIDQGRFGLTVHVDPAGKPDFALHHLVDDCQWRASWPGEGDLANINIVAGHHTRECEFSAMPQITESTAVDRVRAYLDLHEGCDLHTDYIAHHMRPRKPGYLVTPADLLASDLRTVLAAAERAEAAIERTVTKMREYGHGSVNVRQVINLLSPTWPDGNYEISAPTQDGEQG